MTPTYQPKTTAVLLVDPYNDFLSEGGKLWPLAKPIAEEIGLLDNLRAIMRAAREAGLGIFFVPHHRWEQGQYDGWKYPTPYQLTGNKNQIFATSRQAAKVLTGGFSSRSSLPLQPS